ncbi:hypothetical protein [Sulfitobacter sp.]|uniref:hypothetical protein n=1 Tax=Sulfitobacter sp. TaxID=1903071 RepID=UPI003001E871
MFKKLFSTDRAMTPDNVSANQSRGLGTLQMAYADWRFGNDVAAIVVAFNRLSNRRLHMIGLRRETLFDSVGEMMVHAEEEREIGLEIVAIIDISANKDLLCDDALLPAEFPKETETAVQKRDT